MPEKSLEWNLPSSSADTHRKEKLRKIRKKKNQIEVEESWVRIQHIGECKRRECVIKRYNYKQVKIEQIAVPYVKGWRMNLSV
uniref:Uncharacterized protein n=1 Tax=Cucumis melo TaxID=3656 RepID=A0A9I9E7D1_CUCME